MERIIRHSACINLCHVAQHQQCSGDEAVYREELNRDLSLSIATILQSISSLMMDNFHGKDNIKIGFPAIISLDLEVDKWDLTVRGTMEWSDDCDVLSGTGMEGW